ncbi:MAG: putative enoyl-CoA hydratase echA6 [Alphaproteobacteria bacterium MarineAlpha9_Bin4]|nr:enoyl-CoA hydratase [Pelagibacterales bacterium]PPR24625.1 MAG: putative enoyl-CoA hydratase echA6 [Alphaproteobacteria bacterium MarineAlpha9_Bin4]|tara:strand:+ start:1332 stop:2120 length:789 start_codon:yes stop_codon:yes gene_type:complete
MQNDLLVNDNEGILEITFNRPERKNAISRNMFEELLGILEKNIYKSNLKALFLSGSGDAFSAGGDVKDMAANTENISLQEKTQNLRRIMEISKIIYNSPVPTVAVINGVAAGAGFALSLACDFRISTELGKFTTAFSKVGFSGDFGVSFFLSKIVGTSKAKELLFFSDVIDAKNAFQLGIINYLIESNNQQEFINEIKNKFKKLAPIAIKYIKKNIINFDTGNFEKYLEDEALYQMICSETEDHKNAVKAFVNKEKMKFQGK